MVELIYPIEKYAPVIPAKNSKDAEDFTGGKDRKEYLPVIEETGIVIGMAEREYCHSGFKLLHPVVHLHVIDRNGRIYLQKRAMTKHIQPGKWDTSVGGHVSYGESILEALYRESEEELSLTKFNPTFICPYVFESPVEKEFVSVFATVGSSFELKPDKEEIDEGRFWYLTDVDAYLGKDIFTPNFESEYRAIRARLISLL